METTQSPPDGSPPAPMSQAAFADIMARHGRWLRGEPDGSRANLSGANLSRANLSGADLSRANLSGADLSRANLSDAYLSDANLSGANLSDAYLSRANLSRANLSGANLSRADLSGANLSGANLSGANLSGANLSDAYLSGADLSGADLSGANLSDADLSGAYLSGAKNVPPGGETAAPAEPYRRAVDAAGFARRAERYRARHPDVPVVADLDAKILQVIESGVGKLDMGAWHTCETTHCRAGWAITLAGDAGRALESKRGPAMAGHMIYLASTGRSAHFFATTEAAMADIRRRAEERAAIQDDVAALMRILDLAAASEER